MIYEAEMTSKIIGLAMHVHSNLGPGLLESTYKECLFYKIINSGILIEKEKPLALVYEGVNLECGYRLDLLVEKKLVVEIKSVEELSPIHTAQVLTYMKLGNYPLGLLVNFNVLQLKDGIKRVINKRYF